MILGYVTLILLLSAGAAQGLSGSNTVFTDDIVDGNVKTSDIRADAVTSGRIAPGAVFGSDIANNAVTSTDIDEATIPGFKRVYTAKVEGDGSLTHGDATSALRNNPGLYYVYFPITFGSACAVVGTSRTQYSPTGYVTTTNNGSYISARISDSNGANADRPFDLAVICP